MMKLFFILLLPSFSQLTEKSVREISFPTEKDKAYQLEIFTNDEWKKDGDAIIGTGAEIKKILHLPTETKVRCQTLTNQWVMVWNDEFGGTSIDFSKWAHEENNYGGGNNERQFYSVKSKYSFVQDGALHLCAYRDANTSVDGKKSNYTSARLRTLYRGEWKYGKIEIRAKLPNGEGIWPAIWMLPTNSPYGTWAASGEIDIMESRGSDVANTLGTLHFGGAWPANAYKGGTYHFPKKNAAEDFHTYAIEWQKDFIAWYVDDVKWQTITNKDWRSDAAKENPNAPFDQTFHLILNLAVGGPNFFAGTNQEPDKIPDKDFPQKFLIDYVRVWQKF